MVAIITGATRGIGRAIAEKFAAEKINLFITSRSQDDLEKMKIEFERKFPIQVDFKSCDFLDKNEVVSLAKFILDKYNSISILVNNVGAYHVGDLFDREEKLYEQMQINFFSPHVLTSKLVSRLEPKSHIFTIGSIVSYKVRRDAAYYSISKHALRAWHDLLVEEMSERNIKSTLIMPSSTITSSWDGIKVDSSDLIQPKDVAETIWNCYQLSKSAIVTEIKIQTINNSFN